MFDPRGAGGVDDYLNRRRFLHTALGSVPLLWPANLTGSAPPQRPARIVHQQHPLHAEFPLATLDNFITSNDLFYIRNHFGIPQLDPRTWRLRVEGAIQRPLQLTLDEVRRLPARTVTATLECAGNSRSALPPPARGVAWGHGAVSTAEWVGVPLATVLERAGVNANALEVVLEGADAGEITAYYRPPGLTPFVRSIPLSKARQDVILAYRMNNEDLPRNHGYPLRAIVPGWYGMASVKWLSRLLVVARPFTGYFQTFQYTYFDREHGLPVSVPITEMRVKSVIARPTPREQIRVNTRYRIHGAAWSGLAEITRVEVSTDGGQRWAPAQLHPRSLNTAWRLWEYTWQTPATSERVLIQARAHDSRGRSQPIHRDADRRSYMANHVFPVEVEVVR